MRGIDLDTYFLNAFLLYPPDYTALPVAGKTLFSLAALRPLLSQ